MLDVMDITCREIDEVFLIVAESEQDTRENYCRNCSTVGGVRLGSQPQ